MNKEEKKAIESLENDIYECAQDKDLFEEELFCNRLDVLEVLRLIEKQQEEIKKLKAKLKAKSIEE